MLTYRLRKDDSRIDLIALTLLLIVSPSKLEIDFTVIFFTKDDNLDI